MKALIQKVGEARVKIEGKVEGEIKEGLLVFLGITHKDEEKDIEYLRDKICNLRLFGEGEKCFEKSTLDGKKEILVISQFTLYASCNKGRRPDFTEAARPEIAEPLYIKFLEKLGETGLKVESGKFGAMMSVELINEGPVTILLDSENGKNRK